MYIKQIVFYYEEGDSQTVWLSRGTNLLKFSSVAL